MRELGDILGVPIHVYGPETHITAIVPMALKKGNDKDVRDEADNMSVRVKMDVKGGWSIIDQITSESDSRSASPSKRAQSNSQGIIDGSKVLESGQQEKKRTPYQLFDNTTRAFIYGMQQRAVQGMLDYDYISKRKMPSVAALIYPFGGNHVMKFYWGTTATLIPVYAKMEEACTLHPDVGQFIVYLHRNL